MHSECGSGAKILFLLSSLSVGGSERKTVRLANELSTRGYRIVIAYLNEPDTLLGSIAASVKVVDLRRRGKFSFAALKRLRQLIGEESVETVVAVNRYSILYAGLLARFARGTARVRFIASLNTSDLKAAGRVRMMLYRPMLKAMDLIIFGADYQRRLWLERYFPKDAPASGVLYNGIDVDHFSRDNATPLRPVGWPAARIVIGTVGTLRSAKSHDQLIEAVARLARRGHDIGVVIVGSGPEESKLRRLIGDLGLNDRVHLAGEALDVRPYLAGFDIFALTSSAETFSNAALEALALRCPVIASEVGGMPEMLASGGGLTFKPGSIDAVVEALETLVASEQRRRLCAEQARNTVVQRFSLQSMVDEFRGLLANERACGVVAAPPDQGLCEASAVQPLHRVRQ